MGVKPKTHSAPVSVVGTISKKAISCWGFSASPQAPTWERATSWAGMIAHTWNHVTRGQKLSKPHLAFVDASHRWMYVKSSENLLMVVYNGRKRIS